MRGLARNAYSTLGKHVSCYFTEDPDYMKN